MHFKVFNVLLEKRKKTKLFIIILLNLQFERNTQNNKFSLRQIFSIVFQSATKFSLKILKIHLNFKAVKYYFTSIIFASPSSILQQSCDLPFFSHFEPQINVNKTRFNCLTNFSGSWIGRYEALWISFGIIKVFKTVIFPKRVKPLTNQRFKVDCKLWIVLAKFSSNSESSSNLFSGMLTPKYLITEVGQDKPLDEKVLNLLCSAVNKPAGWQP